MPKNQPVLQHHVPQVYLRNFEDVNKHITAYDQQENRAFVTITAGVAAEKNIGRK